MVERLSVIIPTFNEHDRLGALLACLGQSQVFEVIVADGQSTDGTAELARASGARVVTSRRGRGRLGVDRWRRRDAERPGQTGGQRGRYGVDCRRRRHRERLGRVGGPTGTDSGALRRSRRQCQLSG